MIGGSCLMRMKHGLWTLFILKLSRMMGLCK